MLRAGTLLFEICLTLRLYIYDIVMSTLALNPGGLLRSIFAGYVPLASQNLNPIYIVYFWSILLPIIDPHFSHFWENDSLTLKVLKKWGPKIFQYHY